MTSIPAPLPRRLRSPRRRRGLRAAPREPQLGTTAAHPAESAPEQDEDRQHRERDRRGDHEPSVAQPNPEVASRHDQPHAPVGGADRLRGSLTRPPPRGTARRGPAARERSGSTSPEARARSSTRCSSTSSSSTSTTPPATRPPAPRPGPTRTIPRARPRSRPAAAGVRGWLAAPRSCPCATIRPPSISTTASHSRSTSSSWWLENTTGTPWFAVWRRSTPARTSTPTGSRPENGSSSTSTSGSCTSAAASCTRCWLPRDRLSTRSSARPSTPRTSIVSRRLPLRVGGREPVQPREVDQLLQHPHLRVQAALLRHVAEPAPGHGRRRGCPRHRTSPASGSSTPSDDPHRGGLAGAVRARRTPRSSPRAP